MIRKKPVPAEHLMIRWVEFIGEFQQLSELRVAAIDLNIIEYFCIDVMFVLFAIVSTVVYLIYRLLRIICCYCGSRVLYGQRAPKQKLS
jgi:DNA-directed RNA polymerase subunit RPC12/RpoP